MSEKLNYKSIAESVSKIPIDGFFDGLSKYLSHLLRVDCVMVSKSSFANADNLSTKSIFIDGAHTPNFNYPMASTPCRDTTSVKPLRLQGDLEKTYPNASFLAGQQFCYYLGYQLVDGDNKTVGYLAIYTRNKMCDEEVATSVLKIAANRTVLELVRSESDKKMARLSQGLKLPSGADFYQRLTDIIVSHGSIDCAFICQLFTPDAEDMRIKAISGSPKPGNYTKSLHFTDQQQVLCRGQDAYIDLPSLRALFDTKFSAAVVIKLCNQSGDALGYIGALIEQPLTNTDGILSMMQSLAVRAEIELRLNNRDHRLRYFKEILAATDDLISFVDKDYCYRALNNAYVRKFGRELSELIDRPVKALHGEERFEKILKPSIALALAGTTHTIEMKTVNAQGEDIYIHGRHQPCFDDHGEVIGVAISARDVTELKNVELALALSEARLNTLYNKTPSMFFTIDGDFNIESVNAFGANKLGYQVADLLGRNLSMLYSADDRDLVRERFGHCFSHPHELHEWEMRQLQSNGRSLWVKQTAQVVTTPENGSQIFLASEDISEKHRLSQKLSYQATHDSLTGLNNRLEFERALRKLVERKNEGPQQVHVLCYIDLDKFKLVNDSCGHLAGDELLRNVADILSQCVRKSDVLARIGGDEFAILMEDCQLDKARDIAEKIRVAVKDYVLVWKDSNYQIGASIGLTIFDLQRDSITQALTAADEACYAAKAAGRDKVFVFSSAGRDKLQQRDEFEFIHSVKRAIEHDEFEMYAQPICTANSLSNVIGHELLLRLNYDGDTINAATIMESAQQHQLITKIDEWVIGHGFSWLAGVNENPDWGYCAINISGVSAADPEFLEFVLYQFKKHRLVGHHICFEITETATISNLLGVINFITELKKHGCRFTLDNFGSGVSSFNHMKNLSFDMVKISDEYVAGVVNNDVDRAMVTAIVGICRAMGKTSIAGAVENKETYQYLVEIGVDCVQGFYCGKPQPLLTVI